jgi:alanyl-tRNA synthetase
LTANGWINEIVPLINGKGGGKEASAQATGTNTGALKEAMDIATKFAELKLS